jgi:deoxyribose-phosphate aldolase
MTQRELAATIDHTVLAAETPAARIDRLCDEAMEYGFVAVCVNPIWVKRCAKRIGGADVRIASVIGFPLGASRTDTKVDEARRAIDDGAREIDMVVRLGDLKAGDTGIVRDDIADVADAVHAASPDHTLKVILETAALDKPQIIAGCRCAVEARADYVKTSTGFHPAGGATVEAVRLLHEHGAPLKVKAAGGIRNLFTARSMIEAGASRIGCSIGPKIINLVSRLSL